LAIRGRILHDTREERRMKIALAVLATVLQALALCNADFFVQIKERRP